MNLGGPKLALGTQAYGIISKMFTPAIALAVACAALAIIFACIRYAAFPAEDKRADVLKRGIKILLVITFLASLGSIVLWVLLRTGAGNLNGATNHLNF